MISLTVANRLENQQLTHPAGPLEVGRGPKRGATARIMVQDGFVSRDHLKLEELPNAGVRVENLSARTPVAVDNQNLLTPGQSCDCPLPVRLGVGETVIDVEWVRPDEESSERFLTVAAPVQQHERTMELPSLLSLGALPPVEQVVGWLEPVMSLHRAADLKELYTETARALADRIGLDSGAVLMKEGEVWKTVAYAARDPRGTARPISHGLLRRVVKEKRTFYLPVSVLNPTESLMGVQSVVASPVFNEDQEVVGAVSGTRLVASRKKELGPLEAQVVQLLASAVSVGKARFAKEAEANKLRVAKEAAEQADRTKSQFLAMVSHELRTPLTTILGYTQMLAEQAAADQLPQYADDLNQIETSANHLLTLINDILDLSKIEAIKIELAREAFDPAVVIRDLMASVEPLAKKNANSVTLDCPPDLGPTVGDAVRLRQCVLNLVANACKFTTAGQVKVTAYRTSAEGLEWIRVEVADTGIGMSPDQMDRLFQPFTQVDSSAGRKHGGTGLGLAISMKLAQAMGGRILVESQLGKGSTFTLVVRAMLPKKGDSVAIPVAKG
jgi:signal transduction histidine kinase